MFCYTCRTNVLTKTVIIERKKKRLVQHLCTVCGKDTKHPTKKQKEEYARTIQRKDKKTLDEHKELDNKK